MICNYNMYKMRKDAKNADLKLVCCDSPVCDYCARKLHPDDEFEDAQKCEECIHLPGNYNSCGLDDNFLGIQCVTWKEE